MLLDCCEGVRGELLQRSIVAPFGIAFKPLACALLGLDLLLGEGLVKILRRSRVQRTDRFSLTLVGLPRHFGLDIFGLHDALDFRGGLAMGFDDVPSKLLHRLGLLSR